MDYIKEIPNANMLAISRLITRIENQDPEAIRLVNRLYPRCGKAHVIGITGPPGAGKSCLVAALIKRFRQQQKTVGVLAVDPTSPFSGGSFLGDRARMEAFSSDQDVFIRSLASRGGEGGLARAVNDAVDVLDASGKDIILVETVGVGQVETQISKVAQTVLLVHVPGYGDILQAMKAGILEIADIMVVNKADLPGADKVSNYLSTMPPVQCGPLKTACARIDADQWPVPILKTTAVTGDGVNDLVLILEHHYHHLSTTKGLSRKAELRRKEQFLNILTNRIRTEFMKGINTDSQLGHWMKQIKDKSLSPYQATDEVIEFYRNEKGPRRKEVNNE